jgi:Na+/melibiose symporter-like transporter
LVLYRICGNCPIVEEAPAARRGLYGGLTYLVGLIPLYAILGPLIARTLGWQWAYGIMFFFMLGLLVLWYFMKETEIWQKDKKERGNEILKIKTAFKSITRKDISYLVTSSIVYGLWTIAFKLVVTWGGYYFMTWGGKTPEQFQSILTVGGLLLMVGALLTGILTDKIGRNGTLVIGCVGAAIGFFLTPTLITIFYWLIYIFMPIILGWIMIFSMRYFNED